MSAKIEISRKMVDTWKSLTKLEKETFRQKLKEKNYIQVSIEMVPKKVQPKEPGTSDFTIQIEPKGNVTAKQSKEVMEEILRERRRTL